MNHIMKKAVMLGTLFAATIASVSVLPTKTVQAKSLSSVAESISEEVVKEIDGNVTLHKQYIKTLYNLIEDKANPKYSWNSHTVQWVDFDTSSEVKVVTYSGTNSDKWKQLTTRQAAQEFEKNNPEWIVLAGINGDFFENSGATTFQPTNNFMTLGDMYRAEKSSASYRENIGWKNDGSVIVGDPTISTSMYLRLLENDNVTKDIEIGAVNCAPLTSGITLITKDTKTNVNLNGYTIYECAYDVCRISTNGSVFVKGTVDKVRIGTASDSNTAPENGKFYIVEQGKSLEKDLKVGTKLKCEYVYTGEWSNVQNSIGYVYNVLSDGIIQLKDSTSDFSYTTHPRTLIGFKPNGETVFMVVDGRGKESDYKIGVSLPEAGELLRLAGCTSGYNLDGGGSSTLIVRNEFDTFDVVNTPSDGSERADGNHVFVVARNPGFKVDTSASTYNEIHVKLNITNETYYNNCTNILVTCNNETKEYTNAANELIFKNVEDNKEYKIELSFMSKDIYDETKTTKKHISTICKTKEFEVPNLPLNITKVTKNSMTFELDKTGPNADWFENIKIHIGDNVYNYDGSKTICSNLIDDTEYEIYYTYDCKNPMNNKTYEGTSKIINKKTLNYSLPEITKFNEYKRTDKAITIEYLYNDEDGIVENAYLVVNNERTKLLTKIGQEKIAIDLTAYSYDIYLEIEYQNIGGSKEVIQSTVIHLDKEEVVLPPGNQEEPSVPKKKCGKKSMELLISCLYAVSCFGLIYKKKND